MVQVVESPWAEASCHPGSGGRQESMAQNQDNRCYTPATCSMQPLRAERKRGFARCAAPAMQTHMHKHAPTPTYPSTVFQSARPSVGPSGAERREPRAKSRDPVTQTYTR